MAILCHPIHRDIITTMQFRPQDMHLAAMLDNLFTNLPRELSSWKHGIKYDDTIDEFGADEARDDGNELVIEFMEHAIVTAVSFIKQVPPQEICRLMIKYQDGILVLTPKERNRVTSIMPWMERPTAPTDYYMIRKMFCKDAKMISINRLMSSFNRFSLSIIATEKHQLALDASGLPARRTWKIRKMVTPSKVVLLVYALFAGIMFIGLLSQDIPSARFNPPQVLKEEIPSPPVALKVKVSRSSMPMTPISHHWSTVRQAPEVSSIAVVKTLQKEMQPVAAKDTTESDDIRVAAGSKLKNLRVVIKKRAVEGLVDFKKGYIDLVENDDFFL